MTTDDPLASILRVWRERLSPQDAGITTAGRRRAPGLRREELAFLAGISVDYVVRLEQGRSTAPSAQVCAALTRALRLSDAEQAHLLRLAGHAEASGRVRQFVPASLRRLLERLDDHPVAIYDALWSLLSWNLAYAALLGTPGESEHERNALLRHFAGGRTRVAFTDEELDAFESSLVADLRATAARYPDDPRVGALVAELTDTGQAFRARWKAHEIADHHAAIKTVDHPQVGRLQVSCDTLASSPGDLRVLVYTAEPGSEDASKLELILALGTQHV